jgi:hypothetical protein
MRHDPQGGRPPGDRPRRLAAPVHRSEALLAEARARERVGACEDRSSGQPRDAVGRGRDARLHGRAASRIRRCASGDYVDEVASRDGGDRRPAECSGAGLRRVARRYRTSLDRRRERGRRRGSVARSAAPNEEDSLRTCGACLAVDPRQLRAGLARNAMSTAGSPHPCPRRRRSRWRGSITQRRRAQRRGARRGCARGRRRRRDGVRPRRDAATLAARREAIDLASARAGSRGSAAIGR